VPAGAWAVTDAGQRACLMIACRPHRLPFRPRPSCLTRVPKIGHASDRLDAMDVGHPISDIVPGPRGLALSVLVQLEKPVTARALARYSGVSAQTALSLIGELSRVGLVHVERTGGLVLAVLNRDHILAEPLYALARARGQLIKRLSAELARWPDLAAAWLFGSAARGDGDRASDIDLLLVAEAGIDGPGWGSNVAALADHVQAWTGNPAQITEYSGESFGRLVRDDTALIAAIRDDGVPLTPGSRKVLRDVA
jgi:predicted nucleotidyltransferase